MRARWDRDGEGFTFTLGVLPDATTVALRFRYTVTRRGEGVVCRIETVNKGSRKEVFSTFLRPGHARELAVSLLHLLPGGEGPLDIVNHLKILLGRLEARLREGDGVLDGRREGGGGPERRDEAEDIDPDS